MKARKYLKSQKYFRRTGVYKGAGISDWEQRGQSFGGVRGGQQPRSQIPVDQRQFVKR